MFDLDGWLSHLETLHPKTMDLGLQRVKTVAKNLNIIDFSPTVITVAGTNGKGSTVALLEQLYLSAGFRVGAYTSPHLLKFNERIRVNNNAIADASLCHAFSVIEAARGSITLTYFEFATLAALYYFKQNELDLILLEVGLGGRLDAVNIIDPDVAVITSIALDHMQHLGKTRELIGREKAGIFRFKGIAVIGEADIPKSILNKANDLQVKLSCLNNDFHFLEDQTSWSWKNKKEEIKNLPAPNCVLSNAATALQVVSLLQTALPVSQTTLRDTMQNFSLVGRMQTLPGKPNIIFDVAHNPAAAKALAMQLRRHEVPGKTYALLAMLQDKDIAGTAAALTNSVDAWFLAPLETKRGASLAELIEAFDEEANINLFVSVPEAYQQVQNKMREGDRAIVFGSFHTVAAVLNPLV